MSKRTAAIQGHKGSLEGAEIEAGKRLRCYKFRWIIAASIEFILQMPDLNLFRSWRNVARRAAAALLLSISLSGFSVAANAGGSLAETPESEVTSTRQVVVLYATLRERTDSESLEEVYGGARGVLRTGFCTMAFTPIPGLQELADSLSFYIPDQREKIVAIEELSEARFWDELTAAGSGGAKAVVYIHGYNIGFKKSCHNAALFQQALGLDGRLVLFSWPADGNVLNYTRDEADLEWSVSYIEQELRNLVERLGPGRIDVVAHSLGARGVVKALAQMGRAGVATPLLDQLVLVAPDIDSDVFLSELQLLKPLAKRITRYVSDNDRALWLSQEVHGYPRLGQSGEALMPVAGIETIDVSAIGSQRFSGHLYHLFDPVAMADIRQLLATGTPAAWRSGLEAVELEGVGYWRLLPPVGQE